MAEALYRKYRPQVFEDVVGQEHIEQTIKNAIGRDKVSHAYLFTGPRGTGKTTTARLLAKALLCSTGPTADPDGTCENCLEIARGDHPDVYELDAASRTGVENVREEIIGRVQYAPTRGRYKIYIIDEVHMLSTAAFNALLKTLEEPPEHVVFILCTTDPQKVPDTIHSRCQRFDFHRISNEAIVARLGAICVAEDVSFEGEALDLIAYRADGGMRDALTSLEQLISYGKGEITLQLAERLLGSLEVSDMAEIVTSIGKRDIAACFQWTSNYVDTGSDLAQFVRDLTQHVRNMYILFVAGNDALLEVNDAIRRELTNEMAHFGEERLARLLGVLGDLSVELKTSSNPRLSFEIALTRMVRPESDLTLEALAERIEGLEMRLVRGEVNTPGQMPASPPAALAIPDRQQAAASSDRVSDTAREQKHVSSQNDVVSVKDASLQDDAPSQKAEDLQSESPAASEPRAESSSLPQNKQEDATAGKQLDWTNPAALQRTWQMVLSTVKKNKTAHGALFLNTNARYDEETKEIVIEFPNAFAYSAVQKQDIYDLVRESLEQAAGSPIEFRFVQKSTASAEPPEQNNQRPEVVVASFTSAPPDVPPYNDEVVESVEEPSPSYSASVKTQDADTSVVSEGEPDDLDAILAMGFGEGVALEEVNE